MDFWPEFLAGSSGKEFVAGGIGGIAGIISDYPLDTLRILQQQNSRAGSAITILRNVVATEGLTSLYRGMAAPLASVTFQAVALGGVGTGALQSILLSPIELVKIRLQVRDTSQLSESEKGPIKVAKNILKTEGFGGIYRGLSISVLRDAPAHGLYFWTYEYAREILHPSCRKSSEENLNTMLVAGGLAGVSSWIFSYPLDVIKTRIQAQTPHSFKYNGILDCLQKSIKEEGYVVLWRGLGTAVARAFIVNGAVFSAYEITLRCLFNSN